MLRINGFQAKPSTEDDAVMRFVNIRDGIVQGCIASERTETFAEIVGARTARLSFIGNNLALAKHPIEIIEAEPKQVFRTANFE